MSAGALGTRHASADWRANDFTPQGRAGANAGREVSTRQRAKIDDESGGWHAGCFAPVDVLAARRRAGATDAGDTIDVSAIESVVLCSPGGLGEVIADEAITPARSDIVCVRTGWSEAVNARPVAAHGHVVADVRILVGMALHAYTTALS